MTEHPSHTPEGMIEERDENAIMAERRSKLTALREQGVVFPNDFVPTHRAQSLQEQYADTTREELEAQNISVSIAGRMMLKRVMGKASFATVQDGTGQIQFYINDKGVGEDIHAAFKHWDMGDIVAAEGTLFKTQHGELSVRCAKLRLLSKSLRPLPDKFHGLADQELKYRQRYVDLIVSPETRATFIKRTKAMNAVRDFMVENGFMEVETPMLHPIPGGASAKPFTTHHNALDMQMFLRIAPELYLKRLVVGGFERVFEINRNFRNEGVSPRHNPEFTMMEFYAAYTDYRWLMDYTEQLLREVAARATGSANLTYQGKELDLSKPFDRLTIIQAIEKYAPEYIGSPFDDTDFLRGELRKHGVTMDDPQVKNAGLGALQLMLFEEVAEHLLWLQQRYWRSRYSVSFPRLRPCAGGIEPASLMDERQLVQTICAFRLLAPEVELSLSTRESPWFRDRVIPLAINNVSAFSKTQPGGYADDHPELEQFAPHDGRRPEEVASALAARGLQPVWKDWDSWLGRASQTS